MGNFNSHLLLGIEEAREDPQWLKISNLTTSLCPFLQVNTNTVHPYLSLAFKSMINVARFARNDDETFLVDFQPLCNRRSGALAYS